jgi:D-beta-D-heptose 7-phosphate kinase/D-beta-D-heptose 1-phosphate adenosyltransferase
MEKKKKIWCNGCFDILHPGHVRLLNFAKSQGNYLVVGIDSDARVKANKGSDRPINSEQDRKFMLENIKCVDEVVIFGSDEELKNSIQLSGAEFMVLGNDYDIDQVIRPESFPVKFFTKIEGYSSSNILKEKAKRF